MLFENLPLPLPWYPELKLQDRFRQNVAVNAVITQLAPYDGVLPFQFRKNAESAMPTTWKIKCADDDSDVCDMSSHIVAALEPLTRIDPVTGDAMDYFIFKNEKNSLGLLSSLSGGLTPGVYYMVFNFPRRVGSFVRSFVWYSETFRVPEDRFTWDVPSENCNYPCFKWSHNSDITPMHYDSDDEAPFYNLLYLDTFITASEPLYEYKGDSDGYDEVHTNFQKLSIKYRVSCAVPDYIKIALFTMLLHENKYLFTEKNLRKGDIKNLEISVTLSTDGALSFVEMLFEQISLFVKTNCEINMAPPEDSAFEGSPALSTGYCSDLGDVTVHITETFPAGIYGELWASDGGPYVEVFHYISRTNLLAGCTVAVDPGAGYTGFKVKLRTFTGYVGESDISIPEPTC